MLYLPNLLTLMRIGLVPVILILIGNQLYGYALLVFFLAGVSDGLDGFIAKHFDCETELGAKLDPLADKCLLVSVFVMLAVMKAMPFWLVVIVVFRDIIIIGGTVFVLILYGRVDMAPLLVSKLNTLLQILLIIAVLLQLATQWPIEAWIESANWVVAATSIVSGLLYVWKWSVFAMHGEL